MLPGQFFHFQFNFFLSSPKQMIWRRVISSTMSLFDWIYLIIRRAFQEDPCNDFWRVLVKFTWTATCLLPVTDFFFQINIFDELFLRNKAVFSIHTEEWFGEMDFFSTAVCFLILILTLTYAIGLDPWRPRKASNYYNTVVQWSSIFPLNFTSLFSQCTT